MQAGKSFFLPEFIIKYKKNNLPQIQIGFIVSTRVDKRATARNLIKRRMRGAVRELLPRIKAGQQVLVVARVSAKKLAYAQIKKQLEFAFAKAKII